MSSLVQKAQSIRGSVKGGSVKGGSRAPSVRNAPGTVEDHDHDLAEKTGTLNLDDNELPNGNASVAAVDADGTHDYANGDDNVAIGSVLEADPDTLRHNAVANTTLHQDNASFQSRPTYEEPSRSYLGRQIPIVTTYEDDLPETASVTKRRSVAGSRPASAMGRRTSQTGSIRTQNQQVQQRAPSRANTIGHNRPASIAGSQRPASAQGHRRTSGYENAVGAGIGAGAIGEVLSSEQQRALQINRPSSRLSLHDSGPVRSNTQQSGRPQSAFGARPQPQVLGVGFGAEDNSATDGRYSRNDGVLNRSGTVVSRANTVGRSGNLSRAANGGTIGGRRGAFGRGAGASIGTQPEEVLGRDDIHTRAELSERILDDATLRRLSGMEKKDAKRLARVIKSEGKAEAQAVKGSIKELERLVKLQREAAGNERKSQVRLSKWTSREHKARLRFLKEKERYEKIEGELRNAENDYEERRDHAAGLTSQVAEKTQDLDDLRGQKAADDREREVKLLALKNPAHS